MARRRHVDNAGARLARDVNDYSSALQYLDGRDERKIANNTYIVQLANPESIGAKLHRTTIVRWYPDAAPMFGATELNSGGYSTTTTKARMNAFLEGTPWSVVQKRYEWFVHNSRTGEKIPFEDGMLLEVEGNVYARLEHERRGNPARPSGRGRPPGKRPSSRHAYGVPIKGYSVKRHSRRRPLEYARNPGVTTIPEVKAALDHGPYAWPGGYPLYFITADGGALSFDSVKENWYAVKEAITDDDDTSGWRVVAVEVNWEDEDLYDDHSGAKIPSAYGDGDE